MSRSSIQSYRDLVAWQEAMELAALSYEVTKNFPKEEVYGATAQIRRSAVSIAANIAEGYGREAGNSYVQFLKIARGSLRELETHILVAERVKLMPPQAASESLVQCDKVGRLLHGLIAALQRSSPRSDQGK